MLTLINAKPSPRDVGADDKWADFLIDNVPIGIAEKVSTIAPLIPCYHLVSNERIIHVCHLYSYKNERQFISDVEFLCNRYQPISLADLTDYVRHGKKLRNGSFILTFDDGYSQDYSVVAPILLKKGIPAIFFVTTEFIDNKALFYRNKASIIVENIIDNDTACRNIKKTVPLFINIPIHDMARRILAIRYKEANVLDDIAELCGIRFDDYLTNIQPYLSRMQIRKMIEMGFYFGAHSMDHPCYADLVLEDQVRQTIGSIVYLKGEFNLPYSVFAFPHNDHLVTRTYFRMIKDYADLTFGTGGIKKDLIKSNLQRINFENTRKPAKSILTRQFLKKRIYRLLHRENIIRT